MSIVQEIINADDTYEIANQILQHDLPGIDDCEEDERETFMNECRWAIGKKVRQVALMHAFREDPAIEDQTLRALCTSAKIKILNPSFIASVQEFVLLDYELGERTELHPLLETVEAETFASCEKIILALRCILDPEITSDEAV